MLLHLLHVQVATSDPPFAQASRLGRLRMEADSRTAEGMAPLWKVLRPDEARLLLAPADGEWAVEELAVEIERSEESPGLGIALSEIGSSGDAGLVLVEELVEGSNAEVTFCHIHHFLMRG